MSLDAAIPPDGDGEPDEPSESGRVVVSAEGVSKKFRLFKERNQTLKAAVLRGHRLVADDFWALRDVSFDVHEGETFGLIGENGSGKSTMLKCLTKILRPDEGRVAVEGKISALLELGAGFHPELTGRENVFLNGAILGLGQKELRRRFDDIVDFAGIGAFIDEPVKNYSSGMYIRLGFSVAINVDPDVLLVDEVLAVGDEAFQRKCNEKFADLRSQGKTIVLVSHGMGGVQNLCDRVAWFEHGRLKKIGEPREVIEAYVGNVHVDRSLDSEGHHRWGSGEARVSRVELLDHRGQRTTQVHSGDPVTLRIHYDIDEPIERPVFGIAFHTLEGFLLNGTNSREAHCVPEKLTGRGHVDIRFNPFRLLPATYDIHVALVDYSLLHQYDYRQNVLRFDVVRGHTRSGEAGWVSLGEVWQIGDLTSEA
ncbi:MAG: ABC transporter ATP-binding protein [Acidimicrobiaceae bacterium]|nr:ABC transporter ATP-binding protein [Acidimicrobiaceae bacterium]